MANTGPIRPHSTRTSEAPWNGSASESKLGDASPGTMRREFAWVDTGADPDNKGSYKFPHHEVTASGGVGAANMRACISGIGVLNGGRGGARIPRAERRRIYVHLARHLRDGGHEPPALE